MDARSILGMQAAAPAGVQASSAGNAPAPGGSLCIEARDLWFTYDGRAYVLKGVTLGVRRGAMTMVLGRSGSGKTTLLKTLKGLTRPQRGTVTVLADDRLDDRRAPAHAVAYLPQGLGLVRSLSALDNALTGALSRVGTLRSLARSFPKATLEEAKETIARLGLAHKLYEPVYRLSGGERQRVAIARALMQKPSVILADEFVSQLDPITADEILEMMRAVSREGISLLITTHETHVVARFGDRIVVMRDGGVIHDGPSGSLSEDGMVAILR